MSKSELKHEVNPIPEIPFLIYSLSPGKNNIIEWVEALVIYCLRMFGEVGLVIETGDFPDIPKPKQPTEAALKADSLGFVIMEYKEQLKQ